MVTTVAAAAAPAGPDGAPPQLPPWASQLKGNSALSKSFGTAGAAAKPPAPAALEPVALKATSSVVRPSWAAGKPGAAAAPAPAPAPALVSPKAQAAIAQASPRAQTGPAPTKPSVVPPTSSSPKPQAGPMSPKPAPIVVVPSVSSAVFTATAEAAPAAPKPEPEPEPVQEPEGPPVYFAPDPADPSKTKLQPTAVLRTLLSQPLDPLRQWSNSDALRRRKDQWAPAILPPDVALRIVNDVAALLLSEPNVLDLEAPVTVWPR